MMRIEHLQKHFNKGQKNEIHVINDVTFEFPEKGMVAIFGKSGCGKTTLLNVLGGLDKVESGTLLLEKEEFTKDIDEKRNRYIGYIFQNYNLEAGSTVFENVAHALMLCGMTEGEELRNRVELALQNVDMQNYMNRYPNTLSGGQQQRVAIARALVKNPKIILADEPTGNLDEENTLLIMNLLKEIAKEHLVVLVTHEADLVDYYCDKVIELSDGKIVNVKENSETLLYNKKEKNKIYLGELPQTQTHFGKTEITCYGDPEQTDLKLQIINKEGKIYLKISTDHVQILNEKSEVQLVEGVFEGKKQEKTADSDSVKLSELPGFEGKHYGRLFNFKSSLKAGFENLFKKKRRGKKLMLLSLVGFAMMVVTFFSFLGTTFQDFLKVKERFNHNTFYVKIENEEDYNRIVEATSNGKLGVDFFTMMYDFPTGDRFYEFDIPLFSSAQSFRLDSSMMSNAILLDDTISEKLPLYKGKKSDLKQDELVVTTGLAEALLEKSTMEFIKEKKDLLGISLRIGMKKFRTVGIVKNSEKVMYFNREALAEMTLSSMNMENFSMSIQPFQENMDSFQIGDGETILLLSGNEENTFTEGEEIRIFGKEFLLKKIFYHPEMYEDYLESRGISKKSIEKYMEELLSTEHPELLPSSKEWKEAYKKTYNEHYFDYMEYYYKEAKSYVQFFSFCHPNDINSWLFKEKNSRLAFYSFLDRGEEFYLATTYKEKNGKYPHFEDLEELKKGILSFEEQYAKEIERFTHEFENAEIEAIQDRSYYVSTKDYIELSRSYGQTDIIGGEWTFPEATYLLLHTTESKKLDEWLVSHVEELSDVEFLPSLVTPSTIEKREMQDAALNMMGFFITIAVFFVLICLSMFFVMRSSFFERIKEIGIYRAIGVSKKNLMFHFAVETLLLTTCTVFVGFLLASLMIDFFMGISPMVKEFFFYPFWLRGPLMLFLYIVCLLCGMAPAGSLLRKTPSEIMAKYDI